jgi:hypothetical protein
VDSRVVAKGQEEDNSRDRDSSRRTRHLTMMNRKETPSRIHRTAKEQVQVSVDGKCLDMDSIRKMNPNR